MLNFSKLKDMEILYVILGAAAILAIGLLLIKIITALSKKALMRTGLDESMHKFIINVLASMENGYKGMMKLLEEKDRPTAVFCMNDHVAIGALRALHECGVNCPGEISLIGIDNIEASNYTTPKLTTIHTPMQELGSISAKVLVDRIEGGHTISLKVFLPFSIVERESCRAL